MPDGILIIGDDDQVQIDSTYRNHAVLDSGSVVTVTQSGPNNYWIDYTFSQALDEPPLVALNCATTEVATETLVPNGSGKYDKVRIHSSQNTATVNYKIFVPASVLTQTETWGMNVYDSSGDVIFHSPFEYLRIYDVVTKAGSFTGNVTHATKATAYFVTNSIFGKETLYGKLLGIKAVNSTTANLAHMYTAPGTPAPGTALVGYTVTNNQVIVCDSQ